MDVDVAIGMAILWSVNFLALGFILGVKVATRAEARHRRGEL